MQHQQLVQLIPQDAVIRPWVDPVVDVRGFDPRGVYCERYWLSVIGPTASLWVLSTANDPTKPSSRIRAQSVRSNMRAVTTSV